MNKDKIREAFEEEYNTSGYQKMLAPIDCFASGYTAGYKSAQAEMLREL